MVLFALLCAACGGTDPGGPDAGTGDGGAAGADAGEANATILRVDFKSVPGIPGDVGGPFDVRLDSAEISLSDVRAIGDVTPGDETRRDSFVLTWTKSEIERLEFVGAPPGLYSSLRAQISSYRITGTVELTGGIRTGFVISDSPSPSLSMSTLLTGVRLEPGKTETVEVEVDLKDVLQELPWDTLDQGADPIVVDETSGDIDDLRDELAESFGGGA